MMRTVRNLAFFALGLLLGGAASWSYAGYALMQPPQGLGFDPDVGYTWRPNTSTPPANGSWSGHGSVMYNGKRITLPGQWAPAANAGTFARNALRFNPLVFVGGVAISIALDAGLEYINDQWQAQEPLASEYPAITAGYRPSWSPVSAPFVSTGIYGIGEILSMMRSAHTRVGTVTDNGTSLSVQYSNFSSGGYNTRVFSRQATCPAGY